MFPGQKLFRSRGRIEIQRARQRCFGAEKLAVSAREDPEPCIRVKPAQAVGRLHSPRHTGMQPRQARQARMLIQNNVNHHGQITVACGLPGG